MSVDLSDKPTAVASDDSASLRARRRKLALTAAWRFAVLVAFFFAVRYAIRSGIELRHWCWDYTRTIHYFPDVNNGYYWGSQGNNPTDHPRGFLNVYDFVANKSGADDPMSADYRLDYAPLRLFLMTRWVGWTRENFPQKADQVRRLSAGGPTSRWWDTSYDFFAYTLRFNTAMEIWAALGLFLLTRHWVVRKDWLASKANPSFAPPTWRGRVAAWLDRPNVYRGWGSGFIAALLFWYSPAIIVSAHGWPTWDMWIIPFFVWAVYLACIDFWFVAGLVIAVGAMFKGQQLFVAPMFILWPIFMGRPARALRWAIGLLFGVAVIALPWLVTYVPGDVTQDTLSTDRLIDGKAIAWLVSVAIATIGVPMLTRWWRRWSTGLGRRWILWAGWAVLSSIGILLLGIPFMTDAAPTHRTVGWLLVIAIAVVAPIISWRRQLYLAAGTIGTAMLLCAAFFHGSLNWLYIGWGYGTRHYPNMTQGVSSNLAGIMHERYGWDNINETLFKFAAHPLRLWPTSKVLFSEPTEMTVRQGLGLLYLLTFLISTIGMAIQFRRNDRRFLIAMTAPWLMFFAFLPQIHERYLIYAAGVGCCFVAVNWGMVLINVFLTLLTTMMTMQVMMGTAFRNGWIGDFGNDVSPTFKNSLFTFIRGSYPDAGWAVILCAGVYLYLSLAPSRRTAGRTLAGTRH